MKWGTFKDFFRKNWLSYTTFLASWKKRYISRNCRNCDIWWSKIISLNKTKNSFNSIAKTSLRWSLLIQYYECNSELNDLPQKIRNGVLLVVKESWKKIIFITNNWVYSYLKKRQDYDEYSIYDYSYSLASLEMV